MRPLDVVPKGEERVRPQRHTGELFQPFLLFLSGKGFRLGFKEVLPDAVCQYVHIIVGNVYVNGVVPVCPLDALLKGQGKHLGILPQPPDISFIAC